MSIFHVQQKSKHDQKRRKKNEFIQIGMIDGNVVTQQLFPQEFGRFLHGFLQHFLQRFLHGFLQRFFPQDDRLPALLLDLRDFRSRRVAFTCLTDETRIPFERPLRRRIGLATASGIGSG